MSVPVAEREPKRVATAKAVGWAWSSDRVARGILGAVNLAERAPLAPLVFMGPTQQQLGRLAGLHSRFMSPDNEGNRESVGEQPFHTDEGTKVYGDAALLKAGRADLYIHPVEPDALREGFQTVASVSRAVPSTLHDADGVAEKEGWEVQLRDNGDALEGRGYVNYMDFWEFANRPMPISAHRVARVIDALEIATAIPPTQFVSY